MDSVIQEFESIKPMNLEANKDKRIAFLAVFKAVMGEHGITPLLDLKDTEQKAYEIVNRLYAAYPAEHDVLDTIEPVRTFSEPAHTPDQYQGNGESVKPRTPFKGKDGKMMFPVYCGNCQSPSWSPNEGVNTKSCKNCR